MMRPELTVLHVITELDYGGAQEMLVRLCTHPTGQRSVRQNVVSLLDEGIHASTLRNAGVSVYSLGLRRGTPSLPGLLRLIRIMRKEKPDIVMTWLYAADLAGTIAVRVAGIRRVIWNIRCSDMDFRLYSRT